MKKIIWIIFAVVSLGCSTVGVSNKEFQFKPFKEAQLSNGLKVLLIEDKGLPYFSALLLVKAGSNRDGVNEKGLASFTGAMLNKGSSKRNTMQIASSLEQLGSSIGIDVKSDYMMVMASSLATGREALIRDFSEIVLDPIFPETEITRLRQQTLANFKQLPDESDEFASWAFNGYLYGDNHPYGAASAGKPKDLARIQRKDLQKFYNTYYRPGNAILAVAGQLPANIMEQLEANFGKWKSQPVADVQIAKFPENKGIEIEVVNKPGLNQSQIIFGQKGIQRNNPDFLPLRVAASILGGSFTSRLMQEIRVKRGLTYGIYSYYDARLGDGPFIMSTSSRHDKVGEVVTESLNIVKDLRDKGITEQELLDAKAYMKGQFPNALETPEKLAQNLLLLRMYGIPDSYLTDYNANLDKISVQDINRVIKQYMSPENMKIFVYTTKEAVQKQLEPIGKVKNVEFNQLLN